MSELKYPETRMTDEELVYEVCNAPGYGGSVNEFRAVANAAIARSIQDGDLVPVEMLKTLALAVMGLTMEASSHRDVADYHFIDTAAIIERVKGGA